MKSIVLWCASVAVMVLMTIVAVPKATKVFAAGGDFTGAAWSANIGWIDLGNAGASYGVRMPMTGTVRNLSGVAWSSNIGWVSFDSAATTGCPSGVCQARVEWGASGGSAVPVKGWARACSVFASGCSGSLKAGGVNGLSLGGWDGWISLGDGNGTDNITYGVTINTSTGEATGRGWGSEVVGWVDFSGVKVAVTGTATEICGNGIDDDGVGGDAPCAPNTEICGNGIDEDGVGGDAACPSTGPYCPNGTTPLPAGGVANCPSGPSTEICENSIDDDGDGVVNEGCVQGPAPLCTNISTAELANMQPPIITLADLIANHYRQLPDGRCGCQAGYALNAQKQCVKPVYQEK